MRNLFGFMPVPAESFSLHCEEVFQDLAAILRQDALRMKLHAANGIILVADSHDFPLTGLSRDLQAIRHSLAFDHQGMIPGGGERVGHVFEQALPVVLDRRRFAMHYPIIDNDLTTEGVADALVAQADAEERHFRSERANDVVGKAGFARRTGTGRNENSLRLKLADLFERNLVIAPHFQVHLHLAQVLDEIIGERIVIIDD